MILVDTSIWIDHLRDGDARLTALLEQELVLTHPYVLGELALGQSPRREGLADLIDLPSATVASDQEVLHLIVREALFGIGIGWVDVHLLAATRLTAGATFWSRDRRLQAAAEKLSLAARLLH